jgi:hypothetical protein
LASLQELPKADEAILRHLESAQLQDLPPDHPWA